MRAIAPSCKEFALPSVDSQGVDTDQMMGVLPLHSQLELFCTMSFMDTYADSSETP